jgi:hypothetical protein
MLQAAKPAGAATYRRRELAVPDHDTDHGMPDGAGAPDRRRLLDDHTEPDRVRRSRTVSGAKGPLDVAG